MGFNSGFKGLNKLHHSFSNLCISWWLVDIAL